MASVWSLCSSGCKWAKCLSVVQIKIPARKALALLNSCLLGSLHWKSFDIRCHQQKEQFRVVAFFFRERLNPISVCPQRTLSCRANICFFFFFSPWVWRGTLLASQGIVRASLFVLCVGGVMERAGERRTQRNVACSLNRWGLFTPSKSTLTIARNVRYVCLCENSHNAVFAKCFNVLIFNHGCVGMLCGCGRFSGCRVFFFYTKRRIYWE